MITTPRHRRRILHVIQNLNYGGMERLLADIVRHSDQDEFESHVLVMQYIGRFGAGLDDVATLHRARKSSPLSMLRPAALARQIREIRPDVVHSHSGVWYKASLAARIAGVTRVIHTEHGRQSPDPWQARFIDGLASRRTDVAVAVSAEVAELLRRTVVHPSCAVRVVLNGVDTDLHSPHPDNGAIRRELGIAQSTPIIGSIGRLEFIKGYDLMIEAFAILLKEWDAPDPPVLVIAGDGSERSKLERLARAADVTRHVRLLGWRDDVAALLSAFTLFTMSSRSEGTSVSLLEAMSSGLCPVVTRVGGNAAVLGDHLCHRLVPPGNPRALAEAWRDALSDPARVHADARAARKRVQDRYSLESMVRQYESLYREALPVGAPEP